MCRDMIFSIYLYSGIITKFLTNVIPQEIHRLYCRFRDNAYSNTLCLRVRKYIAKYILNSLSFKLVN